MQKGKCKIVALLPIKANSERVKQKNFKELGGKPLFKWVLDSLLQVEMLDKIVINTDARSILKEFGVDDSLKILIHDRPLEICGDMVDMNKVIKNDVERISSEIYLMTHATNPFIKYESINKAINYFLKIKESGVDSLFSVNKMQSRFYNSEVNAINHNPSMLLRTQDLEPVYEENSNLYLFTQESFQNNNRRIGSNPRMIQSKKIESIDIDDSEDWILAEAVASYILLSRQGKYKGDVDEVQH